MRDTPRQLNHLHWPSVLWISSALGLVVFAACLTQLSGQFGYDRDVIDMPVARLVALLVGAGVIFVSGVVAAKKLSQTPATDGSCPLGSVKLALAVMIVAGVVARLILFASEPALEDDYQRYLWDGAVVADGINPYATAPREVLRAAPGQHALSEIAAASGPIVGRINHPDLTTIYPPLTQAAFAIAHVLKPFSLVSWRGVLLVADFATLVLILVLLGVLGRSPLWAAVYWWNPVVLKEFFNSAHMDVLILPFVLGALILALRARPVHATGALACAVGVKVWPVLLLPLIWRQAIQTRFQLLLCGLIFAGLCCLWMLPYLAAGVGDNSGLLAYAQRWTTNSPIFASVRSLLTLVLSQFGDPLAATGGASAIARLLMAGVVSLVAVMMAVKPIQDANDLITRALVIVATLVLLSPAIYPWYTLWMLPFLALIPHVGLILVSATIPLYYSYFYFAAREAAGLYQTVVVWVVWIPVWVGIARSVLATEWSPFRDPEQSACQTAKEV